LQKKGIKKKVRGGKKAGGEKGGGDLINARSCRGGNLINSTFAGGKAV